MSVFLRFSILFLVVFVICSQRTFAQSDDVVRIKTELVQTDVTVVDKRGRFVSGLSANDLELFVDAKLQPLSFFEEVTTGSIDERILNDCDTLLVFGLDHLASGEEAAPGEIEAIKEWLKREGTCLLHAPHHDVGFTDDLEQRQVEYKHHGDALVPRQQWPASILSAPLARLSTGERPGSAR